MKKSVITSEFVKNARKEFEYQQQIKISGVLYRLDFLLKEAMKQGKDEVIVHETDMQFADEIDEYFNESAVKRSGARLIIHEI